MQPSDKNYLRLQFHNRVYQSSATAFQTFFENIMTSAFTDFTKIKPYGVLGDGGNDGYRPELGIYYQVYSPKNPSEKEGFAAEKLKNDFYNLKTNWEHIASIKEYCFVFNDKFEGVSIKIEGALKDLKSQNPEINFVRFSPMDLENIFFSLRLDQITALGFDVNLTNTLNLIYDYFKKIEIDLDRETGELALNALERIRDNIHSLNDSSVILEYEILKGRAFTKIDRIKEATEKYDVLIKRYPEEVFPYLYRAELAIQLGDFINNEHLLKRAEQIDATHWFLLAQKLIREYKLGNQIDLNSITQNLSSKTAEINSTFYRLYSLFLGNNGDFKKANSFIENAIILNPNKFKNYDVKLHLAESQVLINKTDSQELKKSIDVFFSIYREVQNIVMSWGEPSPKNKAILKFRYFTILRISENIYEQESIGKEIFELSLKCYFDEVIDHILAQLLKIFVLPLTEFSKVLNYLSSVEKCLSTDLNHSLVLQFNQSNNLFTEGKVFFANKNSDTILSFIDNVKNDNRQEIINYTSKYPFFGIGFANTLKGKIDLKKQIIVNLPDDHEIEKERLFLLINYEDDNIDEAFDILKNLNLSKLRYLECRQILDIAYKKKAWDFVIIVIEKLINHETNEKVLLNLHLRLFTANYNLGRYPEAIKVGEDILLNEQEIGLLDVADKETLLRNTIIAHLKRGDDKKAKMLLEQNSSLISSYEFRIGVEAEVYIRVNKPDKALNAIVQGIKTIKNPTPEQYGMLFYHFAKLGNMMDFSLESSEVVMPNSFVKLTDQDRWYFVGDDDCIDATKIVSTDRRYSMFNQKKINDKIVFNDRYSSKNTEHKIEIILSTEKYIGWQSNYHAHKLSVEHRWDLMEMIEIPKDGESIDPKFLIARMEDEKKKHGEFFDIYCNKALPLSVLAVNKGGLVEALNAIYSEDRGFIHFSSGNPMDFQYQKNIAVRIINGDRFYLDGSSALVLAETGLLEKIIKNLNCLKIPQSVITLLLSIKEKFRYFPGQGGVMGYFNGNITFTPINPIENEKINSKYGKIIAILESDPRNIEAISQASKLDCFSEQTILPELCDACILAQKNNSLLLTEDYLYLKMNEYETKKKIPDYCSSFALVTILYEQNKLQFDDYLHFFNSLASLRFRFLSISSNDIEKAIFGDGIINIVQPERIRLLNLSMILSEEYGVTFEQAFNLIASLLLKIILDDSIVPKIFEKVFIEILSVFPSKIDKKTLASLFSNVLSRSINELQATIILAKSTHEKLKILSNSIDYHFSLKSLWIPN